jgi:cytochrome P450
MATRATEAKTIPATKGHEEHGAGPDGTNEVVELDLRDPEFMATAYGRYAELRANGRVTRVRFGGGEDQEASERPQDRFFRRETHFVTHYDDVVATLLDDRFSVDPLAHLTAEQREQQLARADEFRPLARSIISIDPPDHTRIRKLVQPSFTGRTMAAMRPGIQAIVDDLLDKAEREAAERGETAPNRRMELIEALAYPFPVTVISDLLGIPKEDREQIRGWTENLLRVDRGRNRELDEDVRAGFREFTAYLKALFVRKRREPTDDMISRLVLAEDDGHVLTEEEALATAFLMYLAGHVTTVNLVGNGVVALLTHPDQLAKLKADPSLAKNVVEETLRYWGPVDFIGRRIATKDLTIAGTPIKQGEQMTVGLAAANRDPDKFAYPDVFDISREDANRHVAFGKGIHVCLGAPLARVEGQVAFETLIRRYPDLQPAVPEDEIRWSGNFLRGFRQVPLLF